MSKVVCVCMRNPEQTRRMEKSVKLLNRRLSPDNIDPYPAIVASDEGIVTVVINPVSSVSIEDTSVCLGHMLSCPSDWWRPGSRVPDGSFALLRSDTDSLELVTDIVGSRSIWYAKTEDLFVASTSQRAIAFLLQDFRPNLDAFSWMLSAGTLGPDNAWDPRIKRLEPDATFTLNRRSWSATTRNGSIDFTPLAVPYEEHKQQMTRAIERTFDGLDLDYSEWDLLLSGGYDSRAILLQLKNREGLRCVTWGLKSSLDDKLNDACVARKLADRFGLEHIYLETENSTEPFEDVLDRYLVAGEGRVDQVSAYMDGLSIWKRFFDEGKGVVRGDEAFGKYRVDNPFETRDVVALRFLSDCPDLRGVCRELPVQTLPEYLDRRKGESLDTWRDRMNQRFELPSIWAALNDVKCSYVEVANPLLSRQIVEQVRRLPDPLRTDKRLFSEIVRDTGPDIDFATRDAIQSAGRLVQDKRVVELVLDTLNSEYARGVLPDRLINWIVRNVKVSDSGTPHMARETAVERLKKFVPNGARRFLKSLSQRPVIDANVLALRASIICKMCKMLGEDAKALEETSILHRADVEHANAI